MVARAAQLAAVQAETALQEALAELRAKQRDAQNLAWRVDRISELLTTQQRLQPPAPYPAAQGGGVGGGLANGPPPLGGLGGLGEPRAGALGGYGLPAVHLQQLGQPMAAGGGGGGGGGGGYPGHHLQMNGGLAAVPAPAAFTQLPRPP
jgi:hypothetical protein